MTMRPLPLAGLLILLAGALPAGGAWEPAGVDLARPRLLMRPGDVEVVQARLDRQPYIGLLRDAERLVRQAEGVALGDHSIGAERIKARAARNLAFLYAIDRTVVDGAVVPFPSPDARAAAAARVRELLLAMFTRSRLALDPPLGGFDRDISTSEELLQYATAYDTMRGAGYDFGADDAAIVARIVALAAELYENYVHPETADNWANIHQNNHRSKTGAALAAAAIAVAEYTPPPGTDPRDVREPTQWLEYGLDQIDLIMRWALVTGDGAYAEGPHYVRYASQNLLPFWRAWDRLVGGATWPARGLELPSFWRDPLFERTLRWTLDVTLPDGTLAPTDDSNPGRCYYFGAAPLSSPLAAAYAWRWEQCRVPYDTDGNISLAPDALVNYDDRALTPAPPAGSPTAFYVEGGTAVFRADWSADAVVAIVQAEHDTASEFGRDRNGFPVAPESHEHPEPGSFLLSAFGEHLVLDPGYLSFGERDAVGKPSDHSMILVNGGGPADYLFASLFWPLDPANRPLADGHATLSDALDAGAFDAARVTARYGVPPALIERRFLFSGDRYLAIADVARGSDAPARYTWLVQGNGGGDSGGTFADTATGGRWERPRASVTAGIAFAGTAPQLESAPSFHEDLAGDRRTHTALRASAGGDVVRSLTLVYPSPAGGEPVEIVELSAGGAAALALRDTAQGRRVVAVHRDHGDTVLRVADPTGGGAGASDGVFALFDASLHGALHRAWAEQASQLAYAETTYLHTRTRGDLGLALGTGTAELILDVADPAIVVDGLPFVPRRADGACALHRDGGEVRLVLGGERRIVLHADAGNAAPAADAGPDRAVMPPAEVVLDGGASCDADGDALTPRWELVSAPAGTTWNLAGADGWTPSLVVDRVGPYRVRLVVTDARGAESRADEVLIVSGPRAADGIDNDLDGLFDSEDADGDTGANRAPVAEPALARRELTAGDRILLDARELFADADGDALFVQAAGTAEAVASVAVDGNAVAVSAVAPGRATVFVSADDGRGGRARHAVPVTVTAPPCRGDCDRDGAVTVAELVTAVDLALGTAPLDRCTAADGDGDGRVAIAELIAAVGRALDGCDGDRVERRRRARAHTA